MSLGYRSSADLVIRNGHVRTLDGVGTIVSGVAIKNGRIIAVGDDSVVTSHIDSETHVVDAMGKTVMPAFTDCHTHFSVATITKQYLIDWEGDNHPATVADVLADVAARARITKAGDWVRAAGLAEMDLLERRLPTRWELDSVAQDHPVMLAGIGNHTVVGNSLALKIAGIDASTEAPPGGRIERADDNEPTGILRETAKLRLDYHHPETVLEEFTVARRLEAIRQTIPELYRAGITSVHDVVVDPLEIESWISLFRGEERPLRVRMLVRGIETRTPYEHLIALGLTTGFGDEWLQFGGVKLSIDGVCALRAAAVYEPYPGEADNLGEIRFGQAEMDECVMQCHAHGIQMAIHAVGARAVDMALESFEKAFAGKSMPHRRHRLEHVHLPLKAGQLERIKRLGLVVSAQPAFVYGIGDAWLDIWGQEGVEGAMALRSMLDHGIPVIGGTDYPMVHDPFLVMRSATHRQTRRGGYIDPAQAVTLDEAMRFQTSSAAFGSFEEDTKGSIEPGKVGDVIILSDDPYEVPLERLDEVSVDTTVLAGKVVYDGA